MRRLSTTTASPAASIARKGCSTAFFGVFALVGLVLFVAVGRSLFDTARTYFWKETPCTIVESQRTTDGPERSSSDDFTIRYRYRDANGRERTSAQFTLGIKESLSTTKIEKLLRQYPVGTAARCYVDAKDPTRVVLQRGTPWFALVLLFPLVFVAVGAIGIISVWRKARAPGSISERKRSAAALTKAAPAIFFGLFALVGGVLLYFVAIRPLRLYWAARSWPTVPCQIVSSSVGSHRSSGKNSSTTYSIDITYRYTIAGREHQSDRYEVMGSSSSGRSGKLEVVARYPAGSMATCYVDPADPTEALLSRELSPFMLVGLIPALFLLVGVGGFVGMIRSALKRSATVTMPGLPSLPVPSVPAAVDSGPTVLTPSASPIAKFVGAVIFALIWNGITSIFVVMAVKSWLQKRPEIFLSIFITPFVLIGLVIVGFAGAMFLNLFNPRVALAVSSQSVPLGGTLDVRWNFRGAVSRIRRLRIVLEGHEEARYRRGTRTSTDKSVFAQLAIAETDDPARVREGHAQLTIPERLMHTWDGGNNKVAWQLQVRGDIPNYPDVSEDFEFTVLPRTR